MVNRVVWVVQWVLALVFVGGGAWKLAAPLDQVAAAFAWAGEMPALLRTTAVLDILGGLGILLPSLTRIAPRVTVLAALGCVALQLGAIVFHVGRGEGADTVVNVVLVVLAASVAWGRYATAPIASRRTVRA